MAQAAAGEQMASGESNPVIHTGLCLLSLDGGGVRGLSTLYILKSLMTRLNHGRQAIGASALKPCELFDLIGGTSTGGLIAIMLGRLEMDVDACIDAYTKLIKVVFEEKAHRTPFNWKGRVRARFDSTKLRAAIEEVIRSQGYSPTDQFDDGKARGCRVFVCAVSKELHGITRLRSYGLPQKTTVSATICEAALSTSAATGFFDPVPIGARNFEDGALGANNPVEEVEGEASDIWCHDTGDLKPLVKCFVSIGTGNPGKKVIEDNLLKFLSKTLVQLTTETEETAKRFLARWRGHYDHNQYFRLNVDQGLQQVGIEEYKEQGAIEAATYQYLDDQQQIFRVRDCVENLKLKQRKGDSTLASRLQEYNNGRILSGLSMERMNLRENNESIRNDLNRVPIPCHYIPFPYNKRFVGREDIVSTLREKLFTPEGGQVVTLIGLGGVGKTQVALKLAHWTQENKPDHSVFWVPAVNGASFDQAYAEISKKLDIRKNSEDEGLRESVRRCLSSKESGKWLLVVDNADDIEILFGSSESTDVIHQYLPGSDHGVILLTTRSRDVALAVGGEVVELPEMNVEEAKSLMTNSLLDKTLLNDEKGVATLLEQLTYLPLAITQAGAYLNRNRVSIAKYVELLTGTEQDVVGLMSREFHDSTRYKGSANAVATTWLVSFRQIQNLDHTATKLLLFLSCIEPKAIPQSMLPPLPSEEATVYAIGTLRGYAFLVRRGDMHIYDMHSLVHWATRIWVKRDALTAQAQEKAIQHVETIFPSSQDYANRDRWRAYLPHTLRLLRGETFSMEVKCNLYYRVGKCMQQDGRIKEAVGCFEECYHWRQDHLPSNDPAKVDSQRALAVAYQFDGKIQKALSLLEEVVKIEQPLAKDHPDRVATLHTLGVVYHDNGQVKKAVALLETVAEINQRLAKDHQHRLASLHSLARAYEENGQIKKAIPLLEEVVKIEQPQAKDHPDRLNSLHALAVAYQVDGQNKRAVSLLKEVVKIREQTLATDHPDRLVSLHALAVVCRIDGEIKEAVSLLKEVVKIREHTLATDHPNRLASLHSLAVAYREDGEIQKAVSLLEEVVKIRGQTLAEGHPKRLLSEHELAMMFWYLGQTTAALQLMEHVVEVRKKVLDEDHHDRLRSEHELATMFWYLGQKTTALQLMEHVVDVRKQILDQNHSERKASESWLKDFHNEMANGKEALIDQPD